jgi:hypothetical protein
MKYKVSLTEDTQTALFNAAIGIKAATEDLSEEEYAYFLNEIICDLQTELIDILKL